MTAAYTGSGSVSLSYRGAGGVNTSITKSISSPYDSVETGVIEVPDAVASAHVYSLAFGAVASPSALLVVNNSGQDLGVRFNSAVANEFQIPTGSSMFIGMPALAGADPITAIDLVTTALGTEAGTIEYVILGT